MFRALNVHLQEEYTVYMQHMVLSLYERSWWPVGAQCAQYHKISFAQLQCLETHN